VIAVIAFQRTMDPFPDHILRDIMRRDALLLEILRHALDDIACGCRQQMYR
jgi:hypothetical protein